jgi:hypothetical protein
VRPGTAVPTLPNDAALTARLDQQPDPRAGQLAGPLPEGNISHTQGADPADAAAAPSEAAGPMDALPLGATQRMDAPALGVPHTGDKETGQILGPPGQAMPPCLNHIASVVPEVYGNPLAEQPAREQAASGLGEGGCNERGHGNTEAVLDASEAAPRGDNEMETVLAAPKGDNDTEAVLAASRAARQALVEAARGKRRGTGRAVIPRPFDMLELMELLPPLAPISIVQPIATPVAVAQNAAVAITPQLEVPMCVHHPPELIIMLGWFCCYHVRGCLFFSYGSADGVVWE